uniref:Uncharacterized protein n=1 Tax=Arundo donax TaxID=35708 RepID=A0A0A9CBT9_ARUDO
MTACCCGSTVKDSDTSGSFVRRSYLMSGCMIHGSMDQSHKDWLFTLFFKKMCVCVWSTNDPIIELPAFSRANKGSNLIGVL